MKKAINSMIHKVQAMVICAKTTGKTAKTALSSVRGEGFLDTGVKILISVVIGSLLLAGLYVLFGDTVLPTLTQKIEGLFEYTG